MGKYYLKTLILQFSTVKVAIVGPNGSGKTTLLKMIMGTETAEGEIWISPSANIGYLTQEVLIYRLIKHQKIYF